MSNKYFENKSLFKFLKSEFKNRRNTKSCLQSIISLMEHFPSGILNYQIQKEWNNQYHSIKKSIIHFYPELNCEIKGETASLIKQLKNHGINRIGFEFNKTHLAITSDTLFFFPYSEPTLTPYSSLYKSLEEPFRVIYNPSINNKRYQGNKKLKFISMENVRDKTILKIKVNELDEYSELTFNQIINLNS